MGVSRKKWDDGEKGINIQYMKNERNKSCFKTKKMHRGRILNTAVTNQIFSNRGVQ